MKKFTIYSVLTLLLFVSCKNETEKKENDLTMGSLTISKEHPMPGDNIDITYDNANETEAFYAYMVGKSNYPVDINFSDGEKKSTIKIPDSATALAFIFKTDDTYDANNKEGYVVPLYDKDGKKIAGSDAAMAYFAMTSGKNYGIKKDDKVLMNTISEDLKAHPELKEDWESTYLNMAYRNDKETGKKMVDDRLVTLSQKAEKSEKDYTAMMNLYRMTAQQAKYDSIKVVALEKFPKGTTANFESINNFQSEQDLAKKEQIFKEYSEANSDLGNMGNYMAGSLAASYFEQKDMTNFEKYSSMVADKSSRASTLNNLAWGMAEKGKNLDEAEKMSKTSLDLITSMQKNQGDKPDYFTQRQYEKNLKSSYDMYADTYALILFKQGKVKEAITYQEKAVGDGKSVEVNERYIDFLLADKQYVMAIKKSEEFIKLGHGNGKIKEAYKTAYTKENPTSKDFDEKLKSLEETAHNNYVAEVKKTMLDEEAPIFTLKDTEGKDVSLASLKGKTVILDFWATWCGPCKASFPGMQEVVTKYKDDENVVLLFVDTFENGKDREKLVVDFIKKNKYDFHVVYDLADEGSNSYEVADKYDVTGIPTKVIIGPDGKMKFKSVGYSGSTEKLVKEMDIMIGILKP